MTAFTLHERLANDCAVVGDLPLCRVLLMDDCRFPWAILVPRRAGAVEIHDLPPADRAILIEEIAEAGRALKKVASAEKMNVGALGNVVPQLHVHIVGRSAMDDAWPRPVWGAVPPLAHDAAEVQHFISALRRKIWLG